MPAIADLPTAPGLAWRAATTDDAAGLAAHTRLIHERERLSFLPGVEFFEWLLVQPGIEPASHVRVGLIGDEIVADCGTWLHTGERGSRCIVWAETSPGHETLRPGMIRWVVADARARLEDTTRPRVIRTSVEEHRADLRADYQAAGFTVGRSFAEMARPLVDLPEPRALPDGIHVLAWSDRFTDSARAASNEAFADHWGSLPMNSEEWRGFTVDSPTFRSDLSFVALSGEQVVSFCIAEVDDEDNAERDADDVYINRVGTVTSHRGHGIASHLIVRTLQAAAVSGELDRAALDVDEASHTNATLVYERLGFTTEARSLSYLIELDA